MNKTIIDVPREVRYIGQWQGFGLPDYPHILDKKIPGCGFTEWAICNSEDIILCSPRKILLRNKYDQHKGEVFLVVNEYDKEIDSGKDLNKIDKSAALKKDEEVPEDKKQEYFKKLTHDLLTYIKDRHYWKKPAKILVTYDSFKLIYEILHFDRSENGFRIIVDEFQSIFTDSRFKSTTEMVFMSYLKRMKRVCFVSATPMLECYLDRLDDFKFLPYLELDWESLNPGRVKKPELKIYKSQSIINSARKIIEPYKEGRFEVRYFKDDKGNPYKIESKEAVIFVNSVNNIIAIIKKFDLKPNEVNILVANTEENKKKIRNRLSKVREGKIYDIGTVPLKGEPHKMFTLCTRTVYLGADFYSMCARSFVLSDANIETLAVDISLDLPQILGRQRLEENPWKNSAEFYYIPLAFGNHTPREVFDARVKEKIRKTESLIKSYYDVPTSGQKGDLADNYEKVAKYENYKDQYVAVDKTKTGNIIQDKSGKYKDEYIMVPVLNNLVLVAEERAYDIQQVDYKDRFTVFSSLNSVAKNDKLNEEIENFMLTYESLPKLYDKLKYLCEYKPTTNEFAGEILEHITEKHFKDYITVLGPERCRSLSYNVGKLNKELGILTFDQDILNFEIFKNFNVGDKLEKSRIKLNLGNIYSSLGYKKTPKANDLEEWFEIKDVLINVGNKRVAGFEIIKKKG